MSDQQTQSDKFKQAARDLGCDEDEGHWDETVRKIAAHKPTDAPEPEEAK